MGVALAGVFATILFTDTLCPEHRGWVVALGSAAIVGSVFASVANLRRWAIAPVFTLVVTLLGVAMGLLDAVHAAERGQAIAAAFGALSLVAVWMVWQQTKSIAWDREVHRLATREALEDGVSAASPMSDTATAARPPAASLEVVGSEEQPAPHVS